MGKRLRRCRIAVIDIDVLNTAQAVVGIVRSYGAVDAALRQTVDGITRTIIPQTAICPPVMPRYNTWEAPTDTAPAIQPTAALTDNKIKHFIV